MAVLLVAAGLAFGACGDTDGGNSSTTSPAISTAPGSTDETAVLAVARQYLNGLAEKDWEAVCDARTEKEQQSLGRTLGGTCEEAVQIAFDTEQFQNFGEAFAAKEPETVSVNGDRAVLDYGFKDPFFAVRKDGEWKLIEK